MCQWCFLSQLPWFYCNRPVSSPGCFKPPSRALCHRCDAPWMQQHGNNHKVTRNRDRRGEGEGGGVVAGVAGMAHKQGGGAGDGGDQRWLSWPNKREQAFWQGPELSPGWARLLPVTACLTSDLYTNASVSISGSFTRHRTRLTCQTDANYAAAAGVGGRAAAATNHASRGRGDGGRWGGLPAAGHWMRTGSGGSESPGQVGKRLELSPNWALSLSPWPQHLSVPHSFNFFVLCLSDCLNLLISPSIIPSLSLSSSICHSSSSCLPFLSCSCVSLCVSHFSIFDIFTSFFCLTPNSPVVFFLVCP